MKKWMRFWLICASIWAGLVLGVQPAQAQSGYIARVLDRAGEPVTQLRDGNQLRLVIERDAPADEDTTYSFYLDNDLQHLADCVIPAGATTCTTAPVYALGWYWHEDGEIRPARQVYAIHYAASGWLPIAAADVTVLPRPVVMVHGFGSSYATWLDYLGPAGYLARTGVPGYAVGDGQVPGVMETGNLLRPALRTNTIARNAEILGEYIAGVKSETGAEQVDLVVHSMGGLISRYYIDRLMEPRDVAQLIMLGTPNGGSDCAVLAQSLGFYAPAALELRSGYIQNVFNPQISAAREVPFYIVAGTFIQRRLFSPCGPVPNDTVVSLESATAIPAILSEAVLIHTDMTNDESFYREHVAPLLQHSPLDFGADETVTSAAGATPTTTSTVAAEPVQFSQVLTGTVRRGEDQTQIIHIDRDVVVASFGLYDPTRSLTVTVRGATGNVITLTTADHGLTTVTDPESLLYLGYGFENPRPGPWQVTVQATDRTPPLGTEYALITLYEGGARIVAELSDPLPAVDESVTLTATLTLGGEAIEFDRAQVLLVAPDGTQRAIPVESAGEQLTVELAGETRGVHGVDVSLGTTLPDGTVAERTIYLAFEAR